MELNSQDVMFVYYHYCHSSLYHYYLEKEYHSLVKGNY